MWKTPFWNHFNRDADTKNVAKGLQSQIIRKYFGAKKPSDLNKSLKSAKIAALFQSSVRNHIDLYIYSMLSKHISYFYFQ